MTCRVCGQDIAQSKYCYVCGWLNGQVDLETQSLKLSRADDAIGVFEIINKYYSDVDVKVSIGDITGAVSFAPGFGTAEASESRAIKVSGKQTGNIRLAFNLRNMSKVNILRFKLLFESNDNSPSLSKKDYFLRPYKTEQVRFWERDVHVDILEPSRLVFDKHMLVFDHNRSDRTLYVTNIGDMAISLNRGCFVVSPGFEVIINSSDGSLTIEANKKTPITVKMLQTNTDICSIMKVVYSVGEEPLSENIHLFHRKVANNTPAQLYQKVVAIDFGTTKTASAYLDILDLNDSDCLSQKAKMIELDPENNKYETKSCIAYTTGKRVLIGTPAEGRQHDGISEFASSMKMQLHKERINFRVGLVGEKKTTTKPTADVITSYLRSIREKIANSGINMDNNIYYFTLPVIDNDGNGVLFKNQKEVTLSCAQAAGFGDSSSIRTITEPEAAMHFIINAIKDNPEKWNDCNLQDGDNICVFDFGGGTLDICFGVYRMIEGKPTVTDTISIGTYSDERNNKISLGGDRLDNRMAFSVCDRNKDAFSLKKQKTDEKGFFSAEFEFGEGKHTFSSWDSYNDKMKLLKEDLSKQWKDCGDEGLKVDDKNSINLTKDIFYDVVYDDLEYAISSMNDVVKEKGIDVLKYIFMVGGTSLIQIIKDRLQSEFHKAKTKVLNAYDYFNPSDNNNEDSYESVRQDAIYPVVRGAAISYMTTVSNLFSINLKMQPINHPDNQACCFIYSKDESFRQQDKFINAQLCWGEWEVTGSINGEDYYKLGSFILEKPEDSVPIGVKMTTKIMKDRMLKVYYQLGTDGVEKEVHDLEIYI